MQWMGIWVHPYSVTPVQVGGVFSGFWGRPEPEWWCNAMVEAQTPRGVYSTSIWYACKVFQHLDMLLMGIWVHPHSECLWRSGVDFWDNFGVDLSLSDDVMPWLRLKPPVERNPHPYDMYKVFKHLDMLWYMGPPSQCMPVQVVGDEFSGFWGRPETWARVMMQCHGWGVYRKIRVWSRPSDVDMSWLRLQDYLECILPPIYTCRSPDS